jgi:hypothetical protein
MCGCGIRQRRVRGGLPGGGETYLRACEASPGAAARPPGGAPPRRPGAGGRGDRVHRGPGQLPHLPGHPSAELDGAPGRPAYLRGRRPDRPACAAVLPSAPRGAAVRLDRPRARPQVHLPAVRGAGLRGRVAHPRRSAAHPARGAGRALGGGELRAAPGGTVVHPRRARLPRAAGAGRGASSPGWPAACPPPGSRGCWRRR